MNKFIQAILSLGFLSVILRTLRGLINPSLQRGHRGEAPLLGSTGYTTPTELEMVLGRTQAAILQKILEWQEHNRRKHQTFRDGHYWTYNTYADIQQNHFPGLHVDTIRKNIRALEKAKLLISCQPDIHGPKWYRVDMKAVSKRLRTGKAPSGTGQKPTSAGKMPTPRGQDARSITSETSKPNMQAQPPISSTTTAPDEGEIPTQLDPQTNVVVDPALPHPTTSNESGEYSIKAEASPANGEDPHGEPSIVEAGYKDDSNTPSLPKVPPKGFSPVVDQLRADLIRFGVLPVAASDLMQSYDEPQIRNAMARARAARSIGNPPGLLISILRNGGGDLPADLPVVNKFIHASPIDEDRLEAMRLETERVLRMTAENPEDMLIPAVPDASDPDALHRLRTDGALV